MTATEINRKYHELFGQREQLLRQVDTLNGQLHELERTCPHENRKQYATFEQCKSCYKIIEVSR